MRTEKWLSLNTESLLGRTVAVTGTTGGLGRELLKYLCSLGASVILVDRNKERSAAFRDELIAKYGVSARCINADLEDMESVKAATRELILSSPDIFIHNAGAYSIPRHKCESGYDNLFQINFVSPYYMIRELLPTLRERGGRVMVVGSIAHNYSKIDPESIDFSDRRKNSLAYGNAKRHLMFSLYELFRSEDRVTLSVTHPGITFTNITAHYPKLIFAIIKYPMKIIFMKPARAALCLLRGIFDGCGYHEWIGPRVFDIWGLPRKKLLRTVSEAEGALIAARAEEIYDKLK